MRLTAISAAAAMFLALGCAEKPGDGKSGGAGPKPSPAARIDPETEKLKGSYSVEKWVTNSAPLDERLRKSMTYTISSDEFATKTGKVKYSLDSSKDPKELDFGAAPLSDKGIYKIEDDTVTIVVARENKERPKTFDKMGPAIELIVLKRAK